MRLFLFYFLILWFNVNLCLVVFLAEYHKWTHKDGRTRARARSHTHTHTLSLTLSLSHTHTHTLSLSLSPTHKHTHTHSYRQTDRQTHTHLRTHTLQFKAAIISDNDDKATQLMCFERGELTEIHKELVRKSFFRGGRRCTGLRSVPLSRRGSGGRKDCQGCRPPWLQWIAMILSSVAWHAPCSP